MREVNQQLLLPGQKYLRLVGWLFGIAASGQIDWYLYTANQHGIVKTGSKIAYLRMTTLNLLHHGASEETHKLAGILRKSKTEAEKILWQGLKNRICARLKSNQAGTK